MPIYEYVCPECRKTFEEWLRIDDDNAERPCPECGLAAPRVLSPTTFILKGGGWYATEYGSRKAEDAAGTEGSAKKEGTAKAEAANSGGNESAAPAGDKSSGENAAGSKGTGTPPPATAAGENSAGTSAAAG